MKAIELFKGIYKPKYIILNIAIAIAYYYIIAYIISIQQRGIPITPIPLYLVYLLVITSSVTIAMAVYSI